MNLFEKKYGIKENKQTLIFHKSRRMFYIYKGILNIAEPNLNYSHAIWFEKEGLVSDTDDHLMNEIVRGMVDQKGDIYFYKGYDFSVDKDSEIIFFKHLKEIKTRLKLNPKNFVYGGLIKKSNGDFTPLKEYGNIGKLLL